MILSFRLIETKNQSAERHERTDDIGRDGVGEKLVLRKKRSEVAAYISGSLLYPLH